MAFSFVSFPAIVVGKALTFFLYSSVPAPAQAAQTDTASVADTSFARITTDTGDFVRGRTTFARYDTPQVCLAAARNAQWIARRDVTSQMIEVNLHAAPLRDTLSASAIDIARRCMKPLSVSTTTPRDLPELMQLALTANLDSVAEQVVTRQLSLVSGAAARDGILQTAMQIYLAAEPARLTAAAALVDRVAETGDAGRRWQLAALNRLLEFSIAAYDPASTTGFANRIITVVNAMSPAQRAGLAETVFNAYRALAAVNYLQFPDSLRSIAVRAQQTWRAFAAPIDATDAQAMKWDLTKSASVEEYVRQLLPVRGWEPTEGVVYPPLQASRWFPAQPPAGIPRLVISSELPQDGRCLTEEVELLYDPARDCLPFYERIRSLATEYGPRLQIVLIAVTHGTAIRTLPSSLEKESERLKWYFLDYLKLPVTLAVVERPAASLPAPDGRQWRQSFCKDGDPDADTSVTACKYLKPGTVLLSHKGERVPLWGPEAQRNLIIEKQVSQWAKEQSR